MSVLHPFQNASHRPGRFWRLILACSGLCLMVLLGVWLWPARTSPPTDTAHPPALTPYLGAPPSDPTPPRAPRVTSANTPPVTQSPPSTRPSPTPLPPSKFFPEPTDDAPETIPLSEPLEGPPPAPFEPEAVAQQHAQLGPSNWMARLPDEEQALIDDTLATTGERVAEELDLQERERILHAHASDLVTFAALQCAAHDLPRDARIVVHARHVRLINSRGLMLGIQATANVPAGSLEMQRCLITSLEGLRFTLELDDTAILRTAFTVGEGG